MSVFAAVPCDLVCPPPCGVLSSLRHEAGDTLDGVNSLMIFNDFKKSPLHYIQKLYESDCKVLQYMENLKQMFLTFTYNNKNLFLTIILVSHSF